MNSEPILKITNAELSFGNKKLWSNLSLKVNPGELIAVLGPNGAGKSTLIKSILGLQPLKSGAISINGQSPNKMRSKIGYIPQQKAFDKYLPLRSHDLVKLGLTGSRWWFSKSSNQEDKIVDDQLKRVNMTKLANSPVGQLSGGEQQRLRIAQALTTNPQLILCDEPLLSLDIASQQNIVKLLADQRKNKAAIVFVTHEINPILPIVDKILYIVAGKWAIGTPQEILTKESLTKLYGTHVDVLRPNGKIVVYCADDHLLAEPHANHHHFTQSPKDEND